MTAQSCPESTGVFFALSSLRDRSYNIQKSFYPHAYPCVCSECHAERIMRLHSRSPRGPVCFCSYPQVRMDIVGVLYIRCAFFLIHQCCQCPCRYDYLVTGDPKWWLYKEAEYVSQATCFFDQSLIKVPEIKRTENQELVCNGWESWQPEAVFLKEGIQERWNAF